MKRVISILTVLATLTPWNGWAGNLNSYSQKLEMIGEHETSLLIAPSFTSYSETSIGKYSGNHFTHNVSEQNNVIKFEKGINSLSSIGIGTVIGSKTSDRSNGIEKGKYNYSGLGDLTFTYKTLKNYELNNIILGADMNISINEHEIASTTTAGNYASGGHSLRPFIGYEAKKEDFVVGGLFAYHIFGEKVSFFKSNNTTTKVFETGGNTLEVSGFVEREYSRYSIGALAGVELQGAKNKKDEERYIEESRNYLVGNIYSKINFNEDLSLSPSLRYRTLMANRVDNREISTNRNMELFLGLNVNL